MSQSDIFNALTHHHDIQRKLCQELQSAITQKDRLKAQSAFTCLKNELEAHAAAEERHLYVPVMAFDDGLELSRHAIAEHHEAKKLLDKPTQERLGKLYQAEHQAFEDKHAE